VKLVIVDFPNSILGRVIIPTPSPSPFHGEGDGYRFLIGIIETKTASAGGFFCENATGQSKHAYGAFFCFFAFLLKPANIFASSLFTNDPYRLTFFQI
jgi:hypothetical protein